MKVLTVLAAVTFSLASTPALAQSYIVHQDHFLTFTETVALPGGIVLPPGRYLFRFAKPSQPSVVQVMNDNRTTVYAALSTVPVRRADPAGYQLTFRESRADAPREIKAWFCEGSSTGHEFVAQAQTTNPHHP